MIYKSEHEVMMLVEAFHTRTLSPLSWNHAAQLTVTLYYGLKFPYAVAFDLLQDGIKWVTMGMDLPHDAEKQQDTSIHFWLETVKTFASKYRNIDDLSALANILITTHRESEMPYNYYEREIVFEGDTAPLVNGRLCDPASAEMPLTAKTLAAA